MKMAAKCLERVKKPVVQLGFINASIQIKGYSDQKSAIKTPLYDSHVKYGGKLVNFAGFLLPVLYSDTGVSSSHIHTRNSASVFDVSHMLQTKVRGKDSVEWFESMCPVDLKSMADGTSSLTVFLNNKGGIIDDLIVTKVNDANLYIVSNAGRLDVDKAHMTETSSKFRKNGKSVDVEFLDVSERALLAVQGPKAVGNLQPLTDVLLEDLMFMTSKVGTVAGIKECRITRCGYTGEDGVEISIPADKAEFITEALLQTKDMKLAGLGARDCLRLEAGLCLYGNDIDENVTPVEANLTWLIAKARRVDGKFPGSEVILRQIKEGVSKRRVGFRWDGAPARKGAVLKDKNSENIGVITSGCPSPSLGGNVAMGYVTEAMKKIGTELFVNVRGKDIRCAVTKMPFVPAKYYTKK